MTGLLILLAACVVVMLMVPPFRAILGWVFGVLWKAFVGTLAIGATGSQSVLTHVVRCHALVARNFLPRSVVLPTVATRDTTRIE